MSALAPHLSILTVRGRETSEEIPEWTAVELQGSLAQRDDSNAVAGREIGALNISQDRKTAVLNIGNHELKGNLVKLPKPCAVTEKAERRDDDGDFDLDGDTQTRGNQSSEYKVVAVVRYKYIFKTRPKPIDGLQHKRQRLGYVRLEKP